MASNDNMKRQATNLRTWLSRKDKIVAALVMVGALCAAVAVMIFGKIRFFGAQSLAPEFYSDLIQEEGSTCWETNFFATTYDPFYKWIASTSLPSAFKDLPIERATLGYQRASVWRVAGNMTRHNTSFFYNSPDPHVLGGVIARKSSSWIWTMVINWGMSVRICFTTTDPLQNSCLWTTPIVWTGKEGEFALLMSAVPFRRASANPYQERNPYAKHGSYLSNFAGNARTSQCLMINDRVDKGRYWQYIYSGKPCKKSTPIVYTPDIISYLAFPSHQCACKGSVCFVGLNITGSSTSDEDLRVKLNSSRCEDSNSFWGEPRIADVLVSIVYFSYSSRWDLHLGINVTFNVSEMLEAQKRVDDCVHGWLQQRETKPGAQDGAALLSFCSRPGEVVLEAIKKSASVFEKYQQRILEGAILDTLEAKVPVEVTDDVHCGIERGQIDRETCLLGLDEVKTKQEAELLLKNLQAFARVADVKRVGEREWKKGSSKRSDVSIEIVTTLLALLLTVAGMLSKKLQDVEDMVLDWAADFKDWVKRRIGMHFFRTGIRGVVICTAAMWSMFALYKSIGDIQTEPELATSGTVLQRSNEIYFLVTTTSSIQITPKWIVFWMVCSFVGLLLVGALLYVYFLMSFVELGLEAEAKQLDRQETFP
ncbi:uncharacterized protein LOC9646482 [Selaginella moellendorffii]|nr:uncharacterized protein LOC9646482 [Selaginella moellendorffii]XP_024522409.1 uncharacterized protein LOC9646482 [Selaginella moellendorffii]|eukprot:XP_024522408.1 uncharacterized protein LOC9646482 [Selaginella moellendorffii]